MSKYPAPLLYCPRCGSEHLKIDYPDVPERMPADGAKGYYEKTGYGLNVRITCGASIKVKGADGNMRDDFCEFSTIFEVRNSRPLRRSEPKPEQQNASGKSPVK